MSDILQGGKLRERVKSGAVSAKDARQALLARQRAGEFVSESVLRWLANFRPKAEPKPQNKKRRKRKRQS
ncbi:MAG: hypothetical protein K5880_14570 [Hydrogenophaga sp.]|uniref:hypothetical protein n=1 Tax=Hydrogenophaga sp. TaxID=1904254 RepID=UPI002635596B|nr:hypothetical protein [Hydrogenophaga sp.]MCV0439842.1 hypothetical protein [Hydrogenophaga sp.]